MAAVLTGNSAPFQHRAALHGHEPSNLVSPVLSACLCCQLCGVTEIGLGKQPEKKSKPQLPSSPSFLVIQPQRSSAEATALKRSQSSEDDSCLLPRDDVLGAMAGT